MSDVAKTPREELECKKKYLYEHSMFWECNEGCKCQILEDDVVDLLNEQQATIDEQKIIIEERDVANERLNRFLIEIGLEKEYIKWEFKKRCVE